MWLWRPWVRVPPPTPLSPKRLSMGCSQAVRHGTLTPAFVGSIPATPANDDPLAQLAEHLTFNQGVRGSNPRWVTTHVCGRGGIGRRAGFRFRYLTVYEFKSLRPHHLFSGYAVVAQLVERHLAKVEVASPSLVYRSIFPRGCSSMVELQPSKLVTWVRFPSPAPVSVLSAISSVGRAPDS